MALFHSQMQRHMIKLHCKYLFFRGFFFAFFIFIIINCQYFFLLLLFSEMPAVFLGWTSTKQKEKVSCPWAQHIASSDSRNRGLLRLKQKSGHARIQRGMGAGGTDHPPEKSHIGFLSSTGPDPLKNHKTIKPAFNLGQTSTRQRNVIKWRFAGGQMMARSWWHLDSSSTHQLKIYINK